MNDLLELLRIPSVSSHLVHAVDVVPSHGGAAPRVLCYGHLDVQPPEPLELWESAPFEPEVRGGWLYARSVADDKGRQPQSRSRLMRVESDRPEDSLFAGTKREVVASRLRRLA